MHIAHILMKFEILKVRNKLFWDLYGPVEKKAQR